MSGTETNAGVSGTYRQAGRTISGSPAALWPAAPSRLQDLRAPIGDAIPVQRPHGLLRDAVGAKLHVKFDRSRYYGENPTDIGRLTAWPVPALKGARVLVESVDGIAVAVRQLLADALPGIDWWVFEDWAGPFKKYGYLHGCLPAPPNLFTGEPTSLELCGEVEGEFAPGTEAWRDRLSLAGRTDYSVMATDLPAVVRVDVATYSNMRYPGVGVPEYF